jgi:hypothetical protein
MRGAAGRTGGLVLFLAGVALAGVLASNLSAEADVTPGDIAGFDISWPQCGKAYPPVPVAFAIIGMNGGKPFIPNPCFSDQYRWAQRVERDPAVYLNVEYPKPGRVEAATGPYGTCAITDEWCRSYNYGYAIGRDVVSRAAQLRIAPSMWWFDVETGNYWSDDPTNNAQVVRGVIDFFRERKLPMGIYSTPRQWRIISGGYAPGLPVWTAGAQGIVEAAGRCFDPSYAFGAGVVRMVQYYDYGFDTNYVCPPYRRVPVFSAADPAARPGPPGRSLSPTGAWLPYWQYTPMIAN